MAVFVSFDGKKFAAREGESVLDCLLRSGVDVPHSCKAGVCQSCLMQVTDGPATDAAQTGLKPTLRSQNYVLACQYRPQHDISIALPGDAAVDMPAAIAGKYMLNHNVVRLILKPQSVFDCEPGQYLSLIAGNVARSYSVANDPTVEGRIELQVRLLKDGIMSGFIAGAALGTPVAIRGPIGNCFYLPGESDYPMVLAGTGTGLAPLFGIAKKALAQSHQGQIHLLHGALREEDLYLVRELSDLGRSHANFHYRPCVLNGESGRFYQTGNIEDVALSALSGDIRRTRLFLCGAPEFVNSLKRKAFLSGIASSHIFSDAFLPSRSAVVAA